MKSTLLLPISLLVHLVWLAAAPAQQVNIPTLARPQIATPKISLPTSRPTITTPNVARPTLTPQTSISFPTTNTTVNVPNFPNVNNFGGLIPVPQTIPGRGTVTTNPALPTEFFNLGDRLIPSPQTINFPYQSLPAQFLPASITPPNNLNSTLPIALIVPTFPNKTATVNQLQLAPALITFPKTKTFDFSPPTLSTFTATPQPTVTTDLNTDNNEDDFPKFGIERILTTPSSTTTKTDFADLDENERTTVLDGGLFNRTLD